MLLRTLIAFFVVAAPLGASVKEYVYRIKVELDQGASIQVGFLAGEHGGVITALHGVLGAKSIKAVNGRGQVVADVRLAAIDVKRDLALLRAPEWEGRAGFRLEPEETTQKGAALTAVGCPYATYFHEKPVVANVWEDLSRRVPSKVAADFFKRKSPATDQRVLVLDGALTPGYSGGPLLNGDGRVVAVINGGVLGESLIAWAIPARSAVWQEPGAVLGEMKRLEKLGHGHLFMTMPDPTAKSTATLSVRFPVPIERVYVNDALLWHPTLKEKREITCEANQQWNLNLWEGQSTNLRFQFEPSWVSYVTQVSARGEGILEFKPKLVQSDSHAAMAAFKGKWTYDQEFKYGLVGSIEADGKFRIVGAREGAAVWDIEDAPEWSRRDYNYSFYDLNLTLSEKWFREFTVGEDGVIYNHTKQTINYRSYRGSDRSAETDIWFIYNPKTKRTEIELRNDKFRLKYK